jgi:glycosyltransferase involved in cell wall biosynthesis
MGKIANPEVSVIVPVFDMEETIDRALDSVLSQTFSDLEIIVVDDGSTDQTANLVSRRIGDRLVLIKHATNRGAAAARNTGITASRGRRIAFLDGDDAWNEKKLACQIKLIRGLDGTSNIAACASGYHLHKGGRNFTFNLNWTPKRFSREIFFGCTISPCSTLLVDRQVFDDIGMFDESLRRLEDWDWLLRFTRKYKMVFVPTPLVDVYVGAGPKKENGKSIDEALNCIRS